MAKIKRWKEVHIDLEDKKKAKEAEEEGKEGERSLERSCEEKGLNGVKMALKVLNDYAKADKAHDSAGGASTGIIGLL